MIRTENLYKKFGDLIALENINIQIHKGEFVAIMGASGSGKTTLMNILSSLDTPSSGNVLIEGIEISQFKKSQKRRFRAEKIGLIFQQFHLIPYLNALENVMLAQHYHSIIDEKSAKEILKSVGLEHRFFHRPSQLSGGEQQRLCIARALINEPSIIFADEPTGNLDEENENLVLEILLKLNKEGRTIVMVTHNPELAKKTQKTIILHHGKLIGINNENN